MHVNVQRLFGHIISLFLLDDLLYMFFIPQMHLCPLFLFFSTLSSSLILKPLPTHHLSHQHVTMAAIGQSRSTSMTSVQTYTQRQGLHTHRQTCDCPLLPPWTIISGVSAAGSVLYSLRTAEISHLWRGNDSMWASSSCV